MSERRVGMCFCIQSGSGYRQKKAAGECLKRLNNRIGKRTTGDVNAVNIN